MPNLTNPDPIGADYPVPIPEADRVFLRSLLGEGRAPNMWIYDNRTELRIQWVHFTYHSTGHWELVDNTMIQFQDVYTGTSAEAVYEKRIRDLHGRIERLLAHTAALLHTRPLDLSGACE